MSKLAKLQSVLRENGAMKVNLDQLLVQPGQTLDQVKAADQTKVKELEGQLEEAVRAAVAAIAGQGEAAAAAAQGAARRLPRVSQEIEEVGGWLHNGAGGPGHGDLLGTLWESELLWIQQALLHTTCHGVQLRCLQYAPVAVFQLVMRAVVS
jgi:hypothetical protein